MKKIEIESLNLFYGDFQALSDIRMFIREKTITALIGSSGCGKSTLLRCINRMNDLIEDVRIQGTVQIDGEDIYKMKSGLTQSCAKKSGWSFKGPTLSR